MAYAITFGTKAAVSTASGNYGEGVKCCLISSYKIVQTWHESGSLKARAGTVSGTTITWGDEVTVYNSATGDYSALAKVDTDKFVVIYMNSNGTTVYANCCTVVDTTITVGSQKNVSGTGGEDMIAACQLDTDKFIMAYRSTGSGVNLQTATVAGTTITTGTKVEITSGSYTSCSLAQLGTDKFIFGYTVYGATLCEIRCGTVSGTTITLGAELHVTGEGATRLAVAKVDTDKFAILYIFPSSYPKIQTGTISGTTITLNTNATNFLSSTSEQQFPFLAFTDLAGKLFGGINQDDSGTLKGQLRAVYVSGTNITLGDVEKTQVAGAFLSHWGCAVDANGKLMYSFPDLANSSYAYAVIGDINDYTTTTTSSTTTTSTSTSITTTSSSTTTTTSSSTSTSITTTSSSTTSTSSSTTTTSSSTSSSSSVSTSTTSSSTSSTTTATTSLSTSSTLTPSPSLTFTKKSEHIIITKEH